jgi:hypothetical protein
MIIVALRLYLALSSRCGFISLLLSLSYRVVLLFH